jgi:hypothetical protein
MRLLQCNAQYIRSLFQASQSAGSDSVIKPRSPRSGDAINTAIAAPATTSASSTGCYGQLAGKVLSWIHAIARSQATARTTGPTNSPASP